MIFGIGKWKTEEWEGEVVDKTEIDTHAGDHDYTTYYLHIEMADGKVEQKSYDHKFWKQFEKGDKIVKRPGERKPVKA